jgi:hypothetical protein
MKLATELIMTEFLKLRAHRARIEAADIGTKAKRARIDAIVEDPFASVALKPWCAPVLNIEKKIIANSAQENSRPQLDFTPHAQKIRESPEEVN